MNKTDEYAPLRAAFANGARIQAWHLNDGATSSNDGRWDTVGAPGGPVEYVPEFGCAPHLYRVHPDDLALLPFDSGLVRDAITEEAIVALVAGPYMYHHKMDDHAMREGKAFDRCRELTIQNIRTFFATRKAFDAAIHAQAGGSES